MSPTPEASTTGKHRLDADPAADLTTATGATDGVAPVSEVALPEYLQAPADVPSVTPSRGWVKISEKSVAKIVAQAAAAVPGTTEYSGGPELLGRNYPRFDIDLDDNSDAVSIDAHVAVAWPAPVTLVAETVRSTIHAWVRDMTGIPVVHVNVTVGPIVTGLQRVTRAELADFSPEPTVVPVRVTARNEKLTPITVSASNESLRDIMFRDITTNMRDIEVTGRDYTNLTPFEVGTPPELTPVTRHAHQADVASSPVVSPAADMRDVTVTPTFTAKSVPVNVADPAPLAPISVPEPAPLAPISARELPTVEVRAPKPRAARAVHAPEPAPLRPIGEQAPLRLRKLQPPTPHRLAQIHADAPRVRSVKDPYDRGLRPITVQQRELKPIYVDPDRPKRKR